jgi:predicted N-acetyltransferase YhbS
MDLEHLEIFVAQIGQKTVGVVAWEPADINDTPNHTKGLLLHGLYVDPDTHLQGIGTRLFQAAERAVQDQGLNGLLVKAQSGAEGFFKKQGMTRLPVHNPERHYVNRYWKPAPAP